MSLQFYWLSYVMTSCLIISTVTSQTEGYSIVYVTTAPPPEYLTCWTCPDKADNEECNQWAPDVHCPLNYTVCRTSHKFDSRTHDSLSVLKQCALPTECSLDNVGCHMTDTPGVKECITCCNEDYCNEPVPHNSSMARQLSVLTVTSSADNIHSNTVITYVVILLIAMVIGHTGSDYAEMFANVFKLAATSTLVFHGLLFGMIQRVPGTTAFQYGLCKFLYGKILSKIMKTEAVDRSRTHCCHIECCYHQIVDVDSKPLKCSTNTLEAPGIHVNSQEPEIHVAPQEPEIYAHTHEPEIKRMNETYELEVAKRPPDIRLLCNLRIVLDSNKMCNIYVTNVHGLFYSIYQLFNRSSYNFSDLFPLNNLYVSCSASKT